MKTLELPERSRCTVPQPWPPRHTRHRRTDTPATTSKAVRGYAVLGSRFSVVSCQLSVLGCRLQTPDTPCLWRLSAIRAWDNCEPTTKKPKTGTFDPPSGAKIPTGSPLSTKKPRKAIPCSASLSYHQAMNDYHFTDYFEKRGSAETSVPQIDSDTGVKSTNSEASSFACSPLRTKGPSTTLFRIGDSRNEAKLL
jgi:hypothetical protein